MVPFTAGLATGCLIGVSGTLLLLFLASALSEKRPWGKLAFSSRKLGAAAVVLLAVAGICYVLEFNEAASVLLLLLSVLAIAKLGGLATGVTASVLAAGMLSYFVLPPIGSLKVMYPNDRMVLALFLLSAILGSRLIGDKRTQPQQRS